MVFAPTMVVFPGGRVDPADTAGGGDPVRRCAIRETAEETGVILAEADLYPWAHWITPEIEPRRYDTRFFVAALPTDQQASDISGETDHAEWSTPDKALAAVCSAAINMLPPTISILIELADLSTVAEVINHTVDRQIEPVLPRLMRTESGWEFRYPQADPRKSPI
jgi:8-oxo-dGTP pyrophosphatase MutT (NUDIX family)